MAEDDEADTRVAGWWHGLSDKTKKTVARLKIKTAFPCVFNCVCYVCQTDRVA